MMKFASYLLVAVCVSLMVCTASSFQVTPQDQNSDAIRNEIDSIVQRSALPIRLSGSSSNAVITDGRMLISSQDILQIKQYGEKAIPILSMYLLGESPREERVAIRLMGVIGGRATIVPLTKVLDESPRAGSREDAIRSLHNLRCDTAVYRALLLVVKNDQNAIVRELAQKEMSSCTKPSG